MGGDFFLIFSKLLEILNDKLDLKSKRLIQSGKIQYDDVDATDSCMR